MKEATSFAIARNGLAETSRRNAEASIAMGMLGRIAKRWKESNHSYLDGQQRVSDVAGGLGAISKVLRMMLQSAVLAVGGYLVIYQMATAGIIIAGAIIAARALAPVDLAIANWKGFVAARQGWNRLNKLLNLMPAQTLADGSARPNQDPGSRECGRRGARDPEDRGAGRQPDARAWERARHHRPQRIGQVFGRTHDCRCWQPVRGKVRLDGAALDQWSSEALGEHIGYLPQDVELLAGTVAENISRFEPKADAKAIAAAARAAGVHELIVGLSEGYETQIGEQGTSLSAGQAQRIALARALYRDPFLVVLDEPNSNLDAEGDEALTKAILAVRARGGVVVVVAHRPSAIAGVDLLMVMKQGRQQTFGPKDAVMAKLVQPAPLPGPLKVVPDVAGGKHGMS